MIEMREIPGFKETFAGEDGNLYSSRRWEHKKLASRDNGRGYLRAQVYGRPRLVHGLVAAAWLGKKPEGMEVNHKDGDKLNNKPHNLEYVRRSGNMRHAFEHGLAKAKRGSDNMRTRISACEVKRLRELRKQEGKLPVGEINRVASRLGVTRGAILSAVSGKRVWRWLS